MYFIVKLFLNTLSLLVVVKLVPGISVPDWLTAIVAALALGVVNAVLRPVLIVLTLPLNILSLGLLTFVINALLFYSVSAFVPGFKVAGFGAAFWGSLLYSIVSWLLSAFAAPGRPRFSSPRREERGGGKYRDAIDVEHRYEEH